MKNTDTTREATTAEPARNGLADKATSTARGIRTRFLPPTTHKGARVRAWVGDDGRPLASVIVPWSYEGTSSQEHERAALACVTKARAVSEGAFFPEPVELVGCYLGNGEHAFAIRTR